MPQQRLADLIELSDKIEVPIFILEVGDGIDLIFRKLNRFHEKTTGMSSDAVAGKRPHEVLPPRMAEGLMQKYLTCVRSGEPYSYEEVLDLPNGELWWQTTLSPIFFDDGRMIGLFGTAVEISARKQKEFRDAALLADLEQLNKEVNTYTAMAAHDVRGPLRKLMVMHELLSEEAKPGDDGSLLLNPMGAQLLADMGTVAKTTLGHVDSILSYARALSLESEPTLEDLDLQLMFADIEGLIDGQAAFSIQCPGVKVHAERIILQIALRNLMENAVKFGRSTCRVDLSAPEEGVLQFVISDDGPGFADGSILSEASKQSIKASPTSGFGLMSLQHMLAARGGRIWLEPSRLETGASVAFTTQGHLL